MKLRHARLVNGIVCAVLLVFFLVHAVLGGASAAFDIPRNLKFLVWAGVVLVCAHVALCVVTSHQMMTDAERPPSDKKKKHLALKWVTGVILLALALVHIVALNVVGEGVVQLTGALLALALLVVLAVHLWAGTKSLLKDLSIDRKYRNPLRAVIVAIAVVAGALLLCALVFAA